MKHDDSTFKYGGYTLQVWANSSDMLAFYVDRDGFNETVCLPNSDAPNVALAIMEAAQAQKVNGDPASADYAYIEAINWLKTVGRRREQEAKSDQITKRRDELAKELNGGGIDAAYDTWAGQPMPLRDAIDRIVELESGS